MFFKKRKKPKVRKYIYGIVPNVLNNNENFILTFIVKIMFTIIYKPAFGNNRREIRKFDNDITTFELISFTLAKMIIYVSNKYPEYEVKFSNKETRHLDIFTYLIDYIVSLHKNLLGWDVQNLINDRIKFHLSNKDPMYSHFNSIIYNSVNLIKPIEEIAKVNLNFEQSIISSMNFPIQVFAYEQSYLINIFDIIDEFFMENKEFGFCFKINPKWI